MRSRLWLSLMGWLLLLGGGGLAHLVQTAGGISIDDVRFEFEPGKNLAALLYRPPNATESTPAPAVLAVHGYINSRETQSGFAIELARRGYVVLAIDQTGHGFSEGAAFSAGYGGPTALRYLRSLPFVDADNIGLEGHSMGGWTALAAAAEEPTGYRSLALVGSSTGPGFAPVGTPEFPRNLGVIFSCYDEFSQLMWGVQTGCGVVASEKLMAVFGTNDAVVPRQLYGSIEAGTARWLTIPMTTHPGDHLSHAAIADTIDWLGQTLRGGQDRSSADQIWLWKELGTLVALIGGVCILLGSFDLVLSMPWFSAARSNGSTEGSIQRTDRSWWTGLLVFTVIAPLTYFPLIALGAAFTPNSVFAQGITNQIMVWAIGNGLITLLLGRFMRRPVSPATELQRQGDQMLRAALAGVLAVSVLYLAVVLSDVLFTTDLRFWVVALKELAPHHAPVFLACVLPLTAFFWISQEAWHDSLSLRASSTVQYVSAIVGSVSGLVVMLAGLYAWLLIRGQLPAVDPLFTIVAIQFVPVLAITSIISVFTWRRTRGIAAGAVMSGVFVTWYVVAGQATHV
jgi:pimeloyl-ACP methyl ester carboxylesterase